MKNKYFAKILGVFLIAGISIVGGEIFLRIYNHYYPSFIFYKPAYNPFRGKPLSKLFGFQLNSGGFHDVEFQPKKNGVFRVIALGDSFTFGVVPYKNNYLTTLEDNLKQRGYNVEILNMGVSQAGPQDYADLLKEEGLPLNPDLVLVSFFMGNDFDSLTVSDKAKTPRTKSHLASLVYYFFSIRPFLNEGRNYDGGNDYDDKAPGFARDKFLEVEYGQSAIFIQAAIRKRTSTFDNLFMKLKTQLEELINLSQGTKAKIAFVIIPDAIQIDASLQQEVKKAFTEYYNKYDFSYPNVALSEWLQAKSIPFLDLHEAFQETHNREMKLYRPNDTHWNIAGNKLAAETIEKFLVTSSLLPSP